MCLEESEDSGLGVEPDTNGQAEITCTEALSQASDAKETSAGAHERLSKALSGRSEQQGPPEIGEDSFRETKRALVSTRVLGLRQESMCFHSYCASV